jgi:predicted nucleic acid-binding protein
MEQPIMVDSCVLINLMREGKDPRMVLMPYLRAGLLYNCGIIRAEVLRGMRIAKHMYDLEAFFDIIPEVPCDAKLWRHVSGIGWTMGRAGLNPPLTDIAIATCASRVKAVLITVDAHFEDIPNVQVSNELPAI